MPCDQIDVLLVSRVLFSVFLLSFSFFCVAAARRQGSGCLANTPTSWNPWIQSISTKYWIHHPRHPLHSHCSPTYSKRNRPEPVSVLLAVVNMPTMSKDVPIDPPRKIGMPPLCRGFHGRRVLLRVFVLVWSRSPRKDAAVHCFQCFHPDEIYRAHPPLDYSTQNHHQLHLPWHRMLLGI